METEEQKQIKAAAKARLQKMLDDINENQAIANVDLANWPEPRTVNGMMIRKREAQDQLASLISGYRTSVSNGIVKVIVTGERAKEFAANASEEGAVVVNGAKLYEDFATAIEPSLDKNRQLVATQMAMLITLMQRFMETHKIHALNQPKLTAEEMSEPAPKFQDLVDHVRKAFRRGNEDLLLTFDLTERVYVALLKNKCSNLVVPVLVYGLSKEEQQSIPGKLFPAQPTITIEATADSKDADLIQQINSKIVALFKQQ